MTPEDELGIPSRKMIALGICLGDLIGIALTLALVALILWPTIVKLTA